MSPEISSADQRAISWTKIKTPQKDLGSIAIIPGTRRIEGSTPKFMGASRGAENSARKVKRNIDRQWSKAPRASSAMLRDLETSMFCK